MRIKLAIFDRDQNYLNKLSESLSAKYQDKFQIYSFTDENIAIENIKNHKLDVLLVNEAIEIDFSKMSDKIAFAYLVDSNDLVSYKGQKVICKYQRVDIIYKEILNIYSEKVDVFTLSRTNGNDSTVIVFSSPIGGVGTSSCAVAASRFFAAKGNKVIYLNLELFGASDMFFLSEGKYDMSDIIFALKSRTSNLQLKLESFVKQDNSGVYFYSQPKVALDMKELDSSDVIKLIDELKTTSSYDYIIVDIDFSLEDYTIKLFEKANSMILISDGTELSNFKLFKACESLELIEQSKDINISNKISVLYNKFSSKTGKIFDDVDIRVIGGLPKYVNAPREQVVDEISKSDVFDKIL